MADQSALFEQGFELQACLSQATFALTQFKPDIQASLHAVAYQSEGFFALAQ